MPVGGFSGMGHRMLPITFSPTDPRCHDNEIWDKISYMCNLLWMLCCRSVETAAAAVVEVTAIS